MYIKAPKHRLDWPENRILVLGISPGKAGSRAASKSVQRVNRWLRECDISPEEYDWQNCTDQPGARPRLNEIKKEPWEVTLYQKLICLGNIPATWCDSLNIAYLKVPHPSGLNRKWNNPETEHITIQKIKEYLINN